MTPHVSDPAAATGSTHPVLNQLKRYGLMVLAAMAIAAAVLIAGASKNPDPITCTKPSATVVLGGVSRSQRSQVIETRFLAQARSELYRSGVCGGITVIEVWSTEGSTRVLWGSDDTLRVVGDTLQARKLSATRALDGAMTTIATRYDDAVRALPAKGSGFLGWRTIAADALGELTGTKFDKRVVVVDDGVQIDDTINLNRPLTVDEATALAKTVSNTADLHRVHVTLLGIGQVAGPPPPAGGEWVHAIRAFAVRTCTATGAECRVVGSSVQSSDS